MCDHVEYLRIDCGNAHCTIERRRLQYTLLYSLDYLAIRGESSSPYIKQLHGARRRRNTGIAGAFSSISRFLYQVCPVSLVKCLLCNVLCNILCNIQIVNKNVSKAFHLSGLNTRIQNCLNVVKLHPFTS